MTASGRYFYIYGRVQGVGFRYQTYHWANQNGIKVLCVTEMMAVLS